MDKMWKGISSRGDVERTEKYLTLCSKMIYSTNRNNERLEIDVQQMENIERGRNLMSSSFELHAILQAFTPFAGNKQSLLILHD